MWPERPIRDGGWRCAPLTSRDAAFCAELHRLSFARGWPAAEFERLLSAAEVVGDRAVRKGSAFGFALSRIALDEAELLTVAVHPEQRARGAAGTLLGFHLSRLAGAGATQVFLEVDEANEPALRLYRRFGFAKVGERPGYYARDGGKPATALVLRTAL